MDDEPAERRLVSDPLDGPVSVVGCRLEGVSGGRNSGAVGAGEEVEVLGWPGGQVLRDERGTTGQEEALSFRQGEEELSDLDLEFSQGKRLVPIGDGGH
ncbi:MAG: hypothetical protein ACYCV4_03010 [Dermatophilaceae bacterium]